MRLYLILGRRFYLAKIKTRELDKGSIKTIDRASIMTQHINKSDLRIKEISIPDRRDAEKTDNPDNYAQQKISSSSKVAAQKSAKTTATAELKNSSLSLKEKRKA